MSLQRFVKKLPGVLQTEVQKEFYAATFDQLFNPANVEQAQGFIGRRSSNVLDPLTDNYLDEPNKDRAAYQLEPIAYAVNAALEDTNQFFYQDMLNYLKHRGGNVLNHDRLFADQYYSFAPPIDVDKFLNYQNYLWLEGTTDSNTAPVVYIQAPSLTASQFDDLIEDVIIGAESFNTSLNPNLVPQNFALSSGMRVQFEGSASYDTPLYVSAVGRSVRLVEELNTLGFDDNSPSDLSTADYITIERGSCEGSPWTRSNRWFHEDAVDAILQLGQLQDGTIVQGGTNYLVGDILPVNVGDGQDGTYIVTSIAAGGEIDGAEVFARGRGYSSAQVNQTGAAPASGFATIQGQDETDFDGAGSNGTFVGGTGYAVGDVLTMSDGSTITVDVEAGGAITGFTITARSTTLIATSGETLTTVSSDPAGNDDFTMTLGTNNEDAVSSWDGHLTTGSNAIIDGVLASAVSRANKARRPILEFKQDIQLYNFGNRFIGEVNLVAATEAFSDIQGQPVGTVTLDGVTLEVGDRIIFLNPASVPQFLLYDEDPDGGLTSGTYWDAGPWELEGAIGAVTRFVWEVQDDGGNYDLVRVDLETGLTGDTVPPVPEGSVVLVIEGDVYTGESFHQFENPMSNEFIWQLSQSKMQPNMAPLYELYDTNGIILSDQLEYPTNDFVGNEIFSYKILTQERLNEQGGGILLDDSVLGFPVETKGFRQLGDVMFENDLEATRYNFTPIGGSEEEINGYYFFKVYDVDPLDCTILGDTYETNWKSSTDAERQRLIDRFLTISDTQDRFRITAVPEINPNSVEWIVVAQGRRLNSSEFVYLSATQEMQLLARPTQEQALPGDGTEVIFEFDQITANLQVYVDGIYQVPGELLSNTFTDYIINSESPFNITFKNAPAADSLVVARNQASGAPGKDQVVEILTYTHELITDDDLGYFEIPNGLENNPNNEEIIEKSWNEFTPHFTSIITEQLVYEGTAFGAGNNYRDTAKDGSLGTFALQNQSPLLKAMLCSANKDLDIIEALRLSSTEYTRFRNKYIKIAQQLINEGFTPFNAGDTIPVSQWVDEVVRRITRAREFDTAFKDTYMIAWNNVYEEEVFTASGVNALFTTTNFVDISDKRNTVYVYLDGVIQLVDRDYTITNDNPIQITMTTIPTAGAEIIIRLYENSAPAHIPATPSKLGLYKVFKPVIFTDDTYATPAQFILGHDGSRTPTFGSYIDDLLLELETRIYNGILAKFRNDYDVPLQVSTYKPGKFRETRWSKDEWDDLIKQSFFKWAATNKADYISNLYYDPADEFTWNYETVVDADDEALPGYWRGIFDFYYDTQTPHTTPWEMLGFCEEPSWWASTPDLGDGFNGYGPAPYLASNIMWQDLEDGLIRRQLNPVTGVLEEGTVDSRYARPGLVANYLPVEAGGALKATPLLAIDTGASLIDPTAEAAADDYNWTDMAPVEYAWRTSESYPFAACEALFLARPGEFGEKFWDPEHIFVVPVDPVQIVSDQDDLRKRLGNGSLTVHGETIGGIPQIQTGYQVWISSRLRSLKKDLSTNFGNLIRTLNVKLGHKMAGFTDKDTLRVFVEGISVSSQASNLLVPAENIDVALYTGAPVGNYFYGGVLVKALANNEYQVFGYDILGGEFTYYERIAGAADAKINVGGKPASFTTFSTGTSYLAGQIVRLNGIFYRATESHTADTFDISKWQKLSQLPTTGGVSVTHHPRGVSTPSTIKYGQKFASVQETFDFLIGYGEWLNEQGWSFETVNEANNTLNDWLRAAKDYLFWVGTQWEEGSLIMLSPSAEKVVLNANEGYPANVEKIINGTYSILDKNGVAIDPRNTVVSRDDRLIEVEPEIAQTGIYGLRVFTQETENIVTFDNVTVFNDVLYDPVLGSRLARLDFRGRRTLGWSGKLEAAGFVITADGLLPNYENMVDSFRFYHDTESLLDNPQIEATARHLIGFDERDYFISLGVLDEAQYQFYQGMVRQKGTRQAVEKLERNKLVTSVNDDLNLVEEWALRLSEFGGVCKNQFTEFLIAANEVKSDPQLVRLSYPASEEVPRTRYFNGVSDINLGADTITIVGHGYQTGEPKLYDAGTGILGDDIGGLVSGTAYYVIVVDDDTIQLATTKANATATTPVPINLTAVGGGITTELAQRLEPFPTGAVVAIDVVSATNTYTIPPTVFITNHPDDTTGRDASAISVLNTDGTLRRIDIINGGTGYSEPPRVAIGLPTIATDSDRAIARIRFDVTEDIKTDDVILIDIDDETRWLTKPSGVACDVATEVWPEGALETYNTPNAGYVHSADIDFQSFSEDTIDDLVTGSTIPTTHGELIWVARDARDNFGVFFMDNYKASTIAAQDETVFDGTGDNGSFDGGDGYASSEVITLSDGTTVLVDAVLGGVVTEFTIQTASTTAFVARGSVTLTTVTSTGAGFNDFTLTPGIANEASGADLPGIGATLTQTPVVVDDGRVTLSSALREDVIKAQFTIDVDGSSVTAINIVDGGFGYLADGEFTITNATHIANGNPDAVIEYQATDGVITGANVKVGSEGTDYFVYIETASSNATGSGYSLDDVLTIVGGAGQAATATITELSTVAAQDETSFDGIPADEGSFEGGTGHAINDVITLDDGTTITVDSATVSTIAFQDQTDFDGAGANGTFTAGTDYVTGDIITMEDGSIIQVDAAGTPEVPAPITQFHIVSASILTTVLDGDTISSSINPSSGGVNFTITLGGNNTQTTASTGIVREFTVTTASTDGIDTNNAALTQASTTGLGVDFILSIGRANRGVFAVDLITTGEYTDDTNLPLAIGATTTVVPTGGTGATLDLTFINDDIVVSNDDVPGPTGWHRYMGGSVPSRGKIYANNVVYDYERVSGFEYILSKDGEPVADDTFDDDTLFFTLVNLHFRTIAERTIFEPILELIDASQIWTDDNGSGLWITESFTAPSTFTELRIQEDLIETDKFVNAFIYDHITKDTLAQIPVYDPFKGIIPGNADLNIRYKSRRDPARYTTASTEPLVDADLAFNARQLGQLWWDMSTSAYLYYEQGSDRYRRDNWGRLFPGSSVDIYEWTRSAVPPADYDADGTPRNTTDYVELREWDPILEEVRTFYYFWVKDRTEIPGGAQRTIAAFEVANIISNPLANLYQWFSPISQTGFMFAGVDGVFTDSDNVFQINYRQEDEEDPRHVEWELAREGDPSYIVHERHWNKMVDSLVGYTDEIDIGATTHTYLIASFNTDASGVDTPAAENITTLADHGFTTGDGAKYSAEGGTAVTGLTDEQTYYVEVISDDELALHPTYDQAIISNPGSRVNITPTGAEVHTLTVKTATLNNFNNALPTASDSTRGYLLVPDPALSEDNRLGIRTRPMQTMFEDIQAARRVWTNKVNQLVSNIILRDVNPVWNASMTTNTLWEWVDWFAVGHDAESAVPVRQVSDTSDLSSLVNLSDGDIVKVTGTRDSLYEYNADTDLFTLIMRENSRLHLLDTIYESEPSLTIALELRELINALQTEVFVNDLEVNNNLIFFAMLNYVFSEQLDLDWVFKTTYIFIDQTGQVLTQNRVFQEDPFDAAIQYITEAKPYQSKIRDFRITRQTEIDLAPGTASEFDRDITISMIYDQIRGGNLSVTEMRIAKFEGQADTSYKGYSTLDSGATQVRLGAAGRFVNNQIALLDAIQAPSNDGLNLEDFDPALLGPGTTTDELEAVAAINAAMTTEFFFDFQGSLLQNTSFGGLPTLVSATINDGGVGYVVGDLLTLDDGSGTSVTAAQIEVTSVAGGVIDGIRIINGGSYLQTPTVDPVNLLGGTGTGANVTLLEFDNASSQPHDTTPWDQVGFESSAFDEAVTSLDGSPEGLTTTIPGQDETNFNSDPGEGSFTAGSGYVAGIGSNDYTSGLTFADANPDTITRTDGTSFIADGFVAGQVIVVAGADNAANNGIYTIATVTATVITLSISGELTTDGADANATILGYDTIILNDGTNITVDAVVGSGEVDQFTVTGGSTTFIAEGTTIGQFATSGSGTGFTITLGEENETTGTFADVPAEETFSGNGSQREFDITTTVPTFFMFAVVDGVEQVLNVDYFFIGSKLVFITAPPSGTDNIQLFTYIEAGDLINPQVTAGITEEMVPLDPRENLVFIADTQNISLADGGSGYTVDDVLTLTAGTFTVAMTVLVTAVDGTGIITGIVLIDSGEYTVLPGLASPTTGGTGATVNAANPSLSFRIHQDTQHNTVILRNATSASTTLSSAIGAGTTVIPVVDQSVLYSTPPTFSTPQVAWIGTERIVYHGISGDGFALVGVIRGTNGTHSPPGGYPSGTKIFGTEGQTIPDPEVYWIDTATAGYASGTDGIWRYNGNDFVHFSDGTDLTMHTTGSIIAGDTLRITTGTVLNKSFFIKELILADEISIINVTTPGTGYAVGDVIDFTAPGGINSLLGGTGATAVVGGVDGNGGIRYITITNRGSGYAGAVNVQLTGIGNGDAFIDVFGDREGLVLAQTDDVIDVNGIVVEVDSLDWTTDRSLAGGLTVATTASAAFIQAEPGNALSIPAP